MFKGNNDWENLLSKKLHILHGARLFYLFLLFIHSFIYRFHLVTGGDGGLFVTLVTRAERKFHLKRICILCITFTYLTPMIVLFLHLKAITFQVVE